MVLHLSTRCLELTTPCHHPVSCLSQPLLRLAQNFLRLFEWIHRTLQGMRVFSLSRILVSLTSHIPFPTRPLRELSDFAPDQSIIRGYVISPWPVTMQIPHVRPQIWISLEVGPSTALCHRVTIPRNRDVRKHQRVRNPHHQRVRNPHPFGVAKRTRTRGTEVRSNNTQGAAKGEPAF